MKLGVLFKTVQFVWQRSPFYIVYSIANAILMGLVPIATLWVSKELINAVAELIEQGGDSQTAWKLLLVQFLIIVMSSLLQNLTEYINRRMEVQLEHDLQAMILQKTTSVPLIYFDLPDFYNHLQRVHGQGNRFLSPLRHTLEIGKSGISILSFLTYLLTVHWSLVVLSVVAAVPIFLVQSKFGNRRFWMLMHQSRTAREAQYHTYLLQDRTAAKEVRLFGLGAFLMQRWSTLYMRNAKENLQLMRKQQGAEVGLDAMTAVFYGGSAAVIIWLIQTTSVKIGDFVAIGQAVQGTQGSINQISSRLAALYEETLYIQDLFRFLDYEMPAMHSREGEEAFPQPLQQGIQLEGVTFQYIGAAQPALQDVSFTVQPGEKIAIVGENGSGKTTLVKCLLGLYPITGGRILYDGIDLRDLRRADLHRHITVIFQDFMQYYFSLRENIMFGNIERADELGMQEAAAASGVNEFVPRLGKGYETYLGRMFEEGSDLSGGQWQKVALARAMYKQGEVMILDEPTAALDPQAELEVFRQFNILTRGKTTFFISHRMSAARMADRILVMERGQVAEIGTHEELIAKGGLYAEMYEAQAQWFNA